MSEFPSKGHAMQELMIRELMICVERIVRPVRAFQSRKLKMRRELLNHLLSAVEEERGRGADDATAIDRAKRRLGEPADVTRELQMSVWLPERLLMAKLPISKTLENVEARTSRRWGFNGRMTMAHTLVLTGTGILMSTISTSLSVKPLVIDRSAWSSDAPLWGAKGLIGLAWLIENTVIMLYCAFAIATSRPKDESPSSEASARSRRRARVLAAIILPLHVIWMILICTIFGGGRSLTAGDLITGLAMCVGTLLLLKLFGRVMAKVRRPYDEWLALEV